MGVSLKQNTSLKWLIITNIIFGLVAIYLKVEIGVLLWVYWFQSVSIGIVNFIRILTQKNFSVEGLEINGRPALKTAKEKRKVAFFFLIHYGLFHFVYYMFLMSKVPTSLSFIIIFGSLIFFANHLISFILNYKKETEINKNIGSLTSYPYIRILPMHLFIIIFNKFILDNSQALIFMFVFIVSKTFADSIMHLIEREILYKSRS